MAFDILPRFSDRFPKLRRGHGTTHPYERIDNETGAVTRKACPCIAEGCKGPMDKKSRETHYDHAANVEDWKAERKIYS
jgi:hypothetical protein